MAAILVRCKTCKHGMKFSAEKAGKRAKCPKCETINVIEEAEEAPQVKAGAEEAAAAVAAPVVAAAPPEDDPEGAYEVTLDPELEFLKKKREEDERARERARRKREMLPSVRRKLKAIADAPAWDRVRFALLFAFLGSFIWLFTHLLQVSYVIIGSRDYPEYAAMIAAHLERRGEGNDGDKGDFPGPGQFWNVNDLNMHLDMISGRQFSGFAKTCLVISTLLYFAQALLWGISYLMSLSVPPRYGTKLQLILSMVLAFFNFLFMFFFKLLPVLGIVGWVMIPFVVPEIAMTEYNMERQIPITIMWGGVGMQSFFENLFTLIIKFSIYLQPTMGCIFLWSVASHMKEEGLEKAARGLTQMSLGTFFILFVFHLFCLCGATPVLVWILRIVYGVWVGFLVMFIISYIVLLWKVRGVLYEKLHPKNELEDDD